MNSFEINHLAAWVAREFTPALQLQIFVKIHEHCRENPSELGYASWLEILENAQDRVYVTEARNSMARQARHDEAAAHERG